MKDTQKLKCLQCGEVTTFGELMKFDSIVINRCTCTKCGCSTFKKPRGKLCKTYSFHIIEAK